MFSRILGLGDTTVVRLPRIEWAAGSVEHEQAWLPVLDAGCGAGEAARALADLVRPDGQVTAIDASQVAIAAAGARNELLAVLTMWVAVGTVP